MYIAFGTRYGKRMKCTVHDRNQDKRSKREKPEKVNWVR
jgi:hypothetical protein